MSAPAAASSSLPPVTPAHCPIPDATKTVDTSLLRGDGVVPIGHFRGRSLVSIAQLTRAEIDRLMSVADYMSLVVAGPGSTSLAQGCILASVFYEPSTRTSSSFQAAMLRLGGQVVSITDVANSSVSKGETLEDTMRCLQCYTNIIALRHPEKGSAERAAAVLQVPLINAGDGVGEHPTQALLDLYTLHGEFGHIDGLTVTMVGDLKNGRTVHSLTRLLLHFKVAAINYVSPSSLTLPEYLIQLVKDAGVKYTQSAHLNDAMKETDVLYVTRVQKERFASLSDYESVKDEFIITPELLTRLSAKSSLRILHPLPRVNELSTELDADPRAAYFRQMKHGLHVRMAIIACLLGKA